MITNIFIGHLLGDYFFQTDSMAVNKMKNTLKGLIMCTLHCFVYTICVCAVTQLFDCRWILIVFFSHFLIDKFSLMKYWMSAIKNKPVKELFNNQFAPIVYIALDNGAHLILMIYGYNLIK